MKLAGFVEQTALADADTYLMSNLLFFLLVCVRTKPTDDTHICICDLPAEFSACSLIHAVRQCFLILKSRMLGVKMLKPL